MIRRTLAAGVATSVAAALLVPWSTSATAADEPLPRLTSEPAVAASSEDKGTVLDLASGAGQHTYIVQLEDPAVPAAGVSGSDRAEYVEGLQADQAALTASIRRITGTRTPVRETYTHALNGISISLTRTQALKVSRLPGVTSVAKDFTRQLTTDRGPQWIGAPSIWDGSAVPQGGVANQGEGVVVGILDTGINPANPSFADTVPQSQGGDGHNHTNPLGSGVYKGVCATDPTWGCNDKLIGYWNFEGTERYDDDGHGSHTASTAAGNQVVATAYSAKGTEHEFSVTSTIKGVAPHANIIGYDVCDGDGCQGEAIVKGIDQAIKDGVDVINYSIGSGSASNPWADEDTLGFLNARAAGVHVATSAGNAGPGAATIGGPADAPWITSVGATTHDRKYVASVTGLTSDAGAGPGDIAGAGLSGPTKGAFLLVDAAAAPYNNPKCGIDGTEPGNTPGDGTFPPNTSFAGMIVVCERGGGGRVEKGRNVEALGAEGMILVNDQASGSSLNGDAHALPTAHITYADGQALRAWMASVTGEKAALSGSVVDIRDANGDIMAAFSSRAPNRAVSMIGPAVSAPGVDILAAAGADNSVEWHFISGTSMASPHTAGALALLTKAQPSWTPAETQSALMTTAERDITDSDGTKADWFDMGSGRIELRRAAKAGLVLDETKDGYLAADPSQDGDVKELNTASMADDECLITCSWTRTFEGTSTGVGTWTVSVENLSPNLTLETDKPTIAVTNGGKVDVTVDATIADGADPDTWLFGTLVLTPPAGSTAPVAHLPVGVLPSTGVLPDSIDITTRRDAGSQLEEDLQAIPVSDLQLTPSGLVPGVRKALSVPLDTTNRDAWDGNGVHVERFTIGAGAKRLVAKLENPTAPDFDMYVGRGAVAEANVECQSASGGSLESCDIADPAAGDWWVLVQNWEATKDGDNIDTTDLVTAVVAGDAGNMRATGPEGPIPGREPFDIRVFWDESELDAGETWYGALAIGTSPESPEDVGVMPVTLNRIADDVTKSANVALAAPGEVITYTVDVAPNVGREDATYSITDPLPAGTTYVEGSATNGATFNDGVVSWSGVLEAPSREHEAYDVTTSKTDSSCVNPVLGKAGYFDLAELGIKPQPAVSGDSKTYAIGSAYQYGLYEQYFPGLRFSDDGFLVFGQANYGGTPGATQSIPDPALPNNVAAMLWQDMEFAYELASNSGVSIASDGAGLYIIEYDNMRKKGDPAGANGTYDFEVIAEANSNDYVFAYDNLTGPLSGVTIGAENADGSGADALVNKGSAAGVISDETVVCLESKAKDVAGASFSYQVRVDPGLADQTLVNKAVHTTDNPGARPAAAPASVKIVGTAPSEVSLFLSPTRIERGTTTSATAQVFSSKSAVPTGTVQFYAGGRLAGTGTLDAAGRTTATLSGFTSAGAVPVTARYLGDSANGASTSPPVNLVVTGPNQPVRKVRAKIFPKMVKPLEIDTEAKLRLTVTAKDVLPTGTVEIRLKGAGKKKTYTVELNERGKAKIALPVFKELGKVKVWLDYLGDAAVKPASKTIRFRVVNRRTVR